MSNLARSHRFWRFILRMPVIALLLVSSGAAERPEVASASNTPPTIAPIATQSTNENTPIAVGFAADDAESGVGGLSFSGVSSNEAIVPSANLVFGGNIPGRDINRSVRITPLPDRFGTTTITVTASDGSLTASRSFDLIVVAGQQFEAEYDGTLRTPRCDHISASCDSGTILLFSRGWLSGGGEVNQPNTINNSCLDGFAGNQHGPGGEAIDRIKVSTLDGGMFAPGKTVKIEFSVWASLAFANDRLDVYYASNAQNPNWTFVTTWAPTTSGDNTWSTTYVLPPGGLQAVRGHFRQGGSASPCTNLPDPPGPSGYIDDHDDLVFRVGWPKSDLNLDGSTDLLWRNTATGQNIGWLMNGTSLAGSAFLPTIADTNWEIRGTGDFNGDGKSDVIWRNKVSGQHVAWLMDGLAVSAAAFLPTIADTNWDIKGVGDFDADGKADVVLRNSATGQNIAWLMNGASVAFSAFLPTIADTNWEIVGVGDFDADSKADVILRNKATGENIAWLMNGASVAVSAFLPTIADTNWEVKGVGVLDGNGKADVVWRNKTTGQNLAWLMDGTTVATSALLTTIADTNWEIRLVGDLDADGHVDIVWRNKITGQNIAWLMNHLEIRSATFLPTIADTNWQINGS